MKFKISLILLLSYAPVVLSQPLDRNYKNYDTTKHISGPVLRITGTEICNNNIDDDNNGLVDDQDFACYFNGFSSTNCKSNSIIWSVGMNSDLYWFDLNTGTQHIVGQLALPMVDITWGANGKLYGVAPISPGIYEIGPNTASILPVNNFPSRYRPGNSLTADAAGNLYMDCFDYQQQKRVIVKFNIASGQACAVADLMPQNLASAGDLTFLNGMLYLSTLQSKIAKINIRTGEITVQPFINATPTDYYGLVSMTNGYMYVAGDKYIYQVDPATMVVNPNPVITLSDPSLSSYGLAAYNELCQAPVCLVKTSIEAAGNAPYCIDLGVQLKGNATPVCNVNIASISWTMADGTLVPGDKVKAVTPGKYYLNIQTNTETCNRLDSFTLQYAPNTPLQVDTAYMLPIGCTCTGSMTVQAGCGSGNFKYEWSTGATTPTINNICPGTYFVKVTDLSWGKDTTIRFNIPVPANTIHRYDITAIGDHCNQSDGSIAITNIQGGTAPFQYAINSQPFVTTPNFASLPAGIYSITVKDNAGCTLQDQTIISPVPGPQKLWYTKKDAYCGLPAGAIVIDSVKAGTPPYSFAIDNGPFNPQKNFTNILPGSGTITVKDNYGCTFNEPYTIYQSEQLRIAINPRDTNICASEKITFIAALLSNNTGLQYLWNNERSTFINTFTTPVNTDSKMIVVATDKNGCTATDTATITTTYCDSLFAKCVLFPNAFSPNNDGLNDTFGPHLGSCEFKSYVMSIYNRWGQLVFETRDRSAKWTGATNGSTPQTGTYIYTCVWEDAAGHIHKHKGAVVLIR